MCHVPSSPHPTTTTNTQTILEDEVDDPVYQVGLWAHRAGTQHCFYLDAFLASLVLFSPLHPGIQNLL